MRHRNGGVASIVLLGLVLAILGGVVFVYQSDRFEQNPPVITLPERIYWNLKEPLKVAIHDDSGLKNYRVVLESGGQKNLLDSKKLTEGTTEMELTVDSPKLGLFAKQDSLLLHVSVTDTSWWDLGQGNSAEATAELLIDNRRPKIEMLASSYGIKRGGAAAVVFQLHEPNLETLVIESDDNRFTPQKFYKDEGGYYASLVAWPVHQEKFSGKIIATDKAGNQAVRRLNFFAKEKKYRTSEITLTEKFIDGKISELIEETGDPGGLASPVQKFLHVNETMRQNNNHLIFEHSSRIDRDLRVDSLELAPFYPLKNGAAVASFGDHRFYLFQGEKISESYHYGLDLASVKHAPIVSTNAGRVAYAGFNGIYGNTLMIDHGMGLYTLYSHCSQLGFGEGDPVVAHSAIANTGMTGLALGDHLHFGVLVQGIEVRPEEWMDAQWMKLNVTDVLNEAKQLIDRQV